MTATYTTVPTVLVVTFPRDQGQSAEELSGWVEGLSACDETAGVSMVGAMVSEKAQ